MRIGGVYAGSRAFERQCGEGFYWSDDGWEMNEATLLRLAARQVELAWRNVFFFFFLFCRGISRGIEFSCASVVIAGRESFFLMNRSNGNFRVYVVLHFRSELSHFRFVQLGKLYVAV